MPRKDIPKGKRTCAACGSGDHDDCTGKVQLDADRITASGTVSLITTSEVRNCSCNMRGHPTQHEPGCPEG